MVVNLRNLLNFRHRRIHNHNLYRFGVFRHFRNSAAAGLAGFCPQSAGLSAAGNIVRHYRPPQDANAGDSQNGYPQYAGLSCAGFN